MTEQCPDARRNNQNFLLLATFHLSDMVLISLKRDIGTTGHRKEKIRNKLTTHDAEEKGEGFGISGSTKINQKIQISDGTNKSSKSSTQFQANELKRHLLTVDSDKDSRFKIPTGLWHN